MKKVKITVKIIFVIFAGFIFFIIPWRKIEAVCCCIASRPSDGTKICKELESCRGCGDWYKQGGYKNLQMSPDTTCPTYCSDKSGQVKYYTEESAPSAEAKYQATPPIVPILSIPIPGLTLTSDKNLLRVCAECSEAISDGSTCPDDKCVRWTYKIPWIGEYIFAFYKWAVSAIAIFAVLIIVNAGFGMVTAGGNATKITAARDSIFAGVIGLMLILVMHQVLAMIDPKLVILKPIIIGSIKRVDEIQRQWESGPVPTDALERINGSIDDYRAAAEAENVPWTLLAATDYMESSNRSNASSLNGCPMERYCDEFYCSNTTPNRLSECTENKKNESKCCCKNKYCFCNSQSDSVAVCAGLCDASSGKRGDLRCTARILQQKARVKFRGRGTGVLTKEMNDVLNSDGTPNFGGTILNAAYLFNGAGYDNDDWLKKYSYQTGYNDQYKGISISAYVMDEFYGPSYHLYIRDVVALAQRGSRPGFLVMFLKLNKPENYENGDINTGKLKSLN